LFPNPADHYTNIIVKDPLSQLDLVLYDLTGRKIGEQALDGLENRMELGDLTGGIYLIKISNSKGVQVFKLLQIVH
jgi:hypothetical protein